MSDEAMKALVIEAMYKGLDEKKHEELLRGALNHLLTPPSGGYGARTTPLQDAWNLAVSQVARDIVTEQVRDNKEVREAVSKMFARALTKVLADDTMLLDKMAAGIVAALSLDRDR